MRLRAALLILPPLIIAACVAVALAGSGPPPSVRALTGHRRAIPAIAFSTDGRYLITGSWDTTVRLWDTRTLRPVRTLNGVTREVNDVALSADGSLAAAAGEDGHILRWDVATGRLRLPVLSLGRPALRVAFSPDGKLLVASGRDDAAVHVFEARTAKPIRTLSGHQGDIAALAFSPDGKTLATADDDAVRLWRVADGKAATTLPVPSSQALDYSGDGCRIVTAGGYASPTVWDAGTGRTLCRIKEPEAHAATFLPEANAVLTAAGSRIALWDARTGKRRATPVSKGLPGYFPDFLLRLAPRLRERQQKPVGGLALSPDGRSIAYTTENTIHIRPLL